MAQLDDVVTEEDVENFRSTLHFHKKPSLNDRDFTLNPQVSGSNRIVGRCTVEFKGEKIADSEDLLFTEEDFGKSACADAVEELEEVLEADWKEPDLTEVK